MIHDVGLVLVAFSLGAGLIGPLCYRSGVRDERERISKHLWKIRRRQEAER